MTRKQKIKILREEGFILFKAGSKHEIWRKGDITYVISRGGKQNPRYDASLRTVIRRAAKITV